MRLGSGEAPLDAVKRAFLKVDRMLLQLGAIQVGTTAAVCLCLRSEGDASAIQLHLANVGDTRAVLVSEGAPAKRLTVDHVALDPNEARRVHQAGGHVTNNRVGGILAITRALGDHTLKGDSGGVTAEPYCFVHTVDDHDRFVVMASDGVWEFVSNEQVGLG